MSQMNYAPDASFGQRGSDEQQITLTQLGGSTPMMGLNEDSMPVTSWTPSYGPPMTPSAGSGCMSTVDDYSSSGYQSATISNFPSSLPSSASTTVNEYPPQPLPPQPSRFHNPPPEYEPKKFVDELVELITNERDKVVLTNLLGLSFSFAVTSKRSDEVCQLMSASPVILDALYNILTNPGDIPKVGSHNDDNELVVIATINLANISRSEAGRAALLGCNGIQANEWPSRGVRALMHSLQSRDSNAVIFAITAIHNLLLDKRVEVLDIAKKQIRHADGIRCIVSQLAHHHLVDNYVFTVIVLDCLQILAYANMDNRLSILKSNGPELLLKTILKNFEPANGHSTDELIELASRVLKSLSVCPANKDSIIRTGGIEILTKCIKRDNQEILKTCLWTLRNLSDVIHANLSSAVDPLVERLLAILFEYSEESCIVTCALGILANLTCNNDHIKEFICEYKHFNYSGVVLLLNAIDVALRDSRDFSIPNHEVLEPAIYTLCHLMNQPHYYGLQSVRRQVLDHFTFNRVFTTLRQPSKTSEDLAKAVEKLHKLLITN